ncbi:Tat pathway signal sequence domain protein [Streptomyces sp. NBC_01429]|uniref:Tat pathway signal sequence domain protein n=1 Tax=Streptomyces sp. NBC_01429 TaxID=2903862 RepID=UPI002E2C5A3E|nr:Tat pathway signal sequence domain protein [Streptomyces sp. NBC_01429]
MGARRTVLTAAGLTAVAALLATGTASATGSAAAANNVLTYGSAAGAAVGVGDVLTSALSSGTTVAIRTTSGGSTGITCTASQFTAAVTANPTAPGTATESVTAHTFGGCTSNILGTTGVQSITVGNLPYVASATSAGALAVTAGSAGSVQTTVRLNTILGLTTCVYTSTGLNGTTSNTGNSITFANQLFTKSSGPVTCPASSYFSATYGPVQDTSQSGSPAVFVN